MNGYEISSRHKGDLNAHLFTRCGGSGLSKLYLRKVPVPGAPGIDLRCDSSQFVVCYLLTLP